MIIVIFPSISPADLELGLFILNFILVGVTFALAYLTCRLIKLQTEPLVHVEATWNRLQFYEGKALFKDVPLVLFIKNKGGGPARDVDFAKMKDDFSIKEGFTKFKQAPLVKEGIKELAPNQEMPLAWLSIPTVSEINRSVKIKFEYKNLAGKSKAGLNFIDFHALIHSLG